MDAAPLLPTLEPRVADSCTRLDDALAVAAHAAAAVGGVGAALDWLAAETARG